MPLALFACTGVRHIEMRNDTAEPVLFRWTLNEDSLANNPFFLSNATELSFALNPQRTNRIKLSFGPGGWSPAEVQKLVGYLTSLEIVSAARRIRLDSLPQLRDYLLARRTGIGGGRIVLAVR